MDFSKLDDDQANVVRWSPGGKNLRVVASAGSGKTTVIVALVTKLVLVDEIPPEDICVITFANRAGRELRTRLTSSLGSQKVAEMTVGTFHSVGLKMLRAEQGEEKWSMGRCTDMNMAQRKPEVPSTLQLWRSAVVFGKMPGTDEVSAMVAEFPDHHLKAANLQRADGRVHTNAKGAGSAKQFKKCWSMVERAKTAIGCWEFDDVLLEWSQLLENKPGKFKVVIVDEAQDNNKIQGEIVWKLAGLHGNVVLVGDLRQTIHEWRGAYPRNFRQADRKLKAETRELRFNYRSTPSIVDLCNKFAAEKPWTLGSAATAVSTSDARSVQWRGCANEFAQAAAIAAEVRVAAQCRPKETRAVLLRTNGQVALYEAVMLAAGVSVNLLGGRSALQSYAARTIINYLKAINEGCAESVSRVLNTPKRYLSRKYGEQLVQTPPLNHESLPQRVARVARAARLKRGPLRGAMELSHFLESTGAAAWKSQPLIVLQLIVDNWNDAGEAHETDGHGVLSAVAEMAAKFDDYGEFMAFWSKSTSGLGEGAVTLSTIHRSKGLEWDHVYVDATDGFLPHHKTAKNQEAEEERLLYVAMSRAQSRLSIFWSEDGPHARIGGISPLLSAHYQEHVPDSDPYNGAEIEEIYETSDPT